MRVLLQEGDLVSLLATLRDRMEVLLKPHKGYGLKKLHDIELQWAVQPWRVQVRHRPGCWYGDGVDTSTQGTPRRSQFLAMLSYLHARYSVRKFAHCDEATVIDAILAGAKGYLLKDNALPDLGDAIAQRVDGASPVSPAIARYLLTKLQRATRLEPSEPRYKLLSPREGEVLELIAQGYRSKEIADRLDISYHTVVHHIRSMYDLAARPYLRGTSWANSTNQCSSQMPSAFRTRTQF